MNKNPELNFPERWDTVQLKRLFRVVTGATPKSSEDAYWGGDINWVTPGDVSELPDGIIQDTDRKITKEGYNNCGAEVVHSGSIVLTKRAPIGEVAILGIDACSNQGCLLLEPIRELDTRFYYRLMQVQKDYLNSLGSGSTFMELGTDDLQNLVVPYPPLTDQRSISDNLENQLEKIRDVENITKELLSRLDEKRESLISMALTKGLREPSTK